MSTVAARRRADLAQTLAWTVLADLPDRWAHTAAVARRAGELAVTVDPAERDLLVAAAWLHDIGYGPALRRTGFHPLDGAGYLRENGWPERVCGLVAHHSGAVYTARVQRLESALGDFPRERSPLSDALTYADQTVGPRGQPMTLERRLAEMLARHGAGSAQALAHPPRAAHLRAVAGRVERRLARAFQPVRTDSTDPAPWSSW
jgi:putative nucleotidyltransferase with HDIG domain